MSVVDAVTHEVIDTVSVEGFPSGLAVTPDGTKVYVTHRTSTNLLVIDTETNSVIATVAVGGSSFSLGNFIVGEA